MLGFSCKIKKFVYGVNEYSISQATNRPMYNTASAVTGRTLAIVRSFPLPGCVFMLSFSTNIFEGAK